MLAWSLTNWLSLSAVFLFFAQLTSHIHTVYCMMWCLLVTIFSQATSTEISEPGPMSEATLIPSTFTQSVPSSENVSCLSIFFFLVFTFIFLIHLEVIGFRYRDKKRKTKNYTFGEMLETNSFQILSYRDRFMWFPFPI
jgi:hypothetical protein